MDVDGFDGGYKSVGKSRLKPYEVEHDSMSQKQIEDLMKQEVDYISGLCGVEARIAVRLLLQSTILMLPQST